MKRTIQTAEALRVPYEQWKVLNEIDAVGCYSVICITINACGFFDEDDDDDLLQLPEVLCLSDKSSGLISNVLDCTVPVASLAIKL